MTHLIIKRRHVVVAALLMTATISTGPALGASAAPAGARTSQVPARICDYDWRQGRWQVKQLIKCAAHHWSVPGGASLALAIADRESHFDPSAYNPSGCAGIYQHMLRYWPSRATTYGFHDWSAFNARANIIVTMRMVRRGGWGPWS
jgi:hypothetical protein